MPKDWRDAHAYDHFDGLDVSGLAWECVRRNEACTVDYDLMRQGGDAPGAWGLRFSRLIRSWKPPLHPSSRCRPRCPPSSH